ncbi:hypothetical protein B5807_01243 [Epicoccum nigrum]|uniref:Uncharacterized protein n=1 Tax=Epicoccum nigrum TaxID=105696 RepID=A0A1Y2MEL5_EPING|nr:hypothetical protein B5807_01243 [Epicoccum nigrum]
MCGQNPPERRMVRLTCLETASHAQPMVENLGSDVHINYPRFPGIRRATPSSYINRPIRTAVFLFLHAALFDQVPSHIAYSSLWDPESDTITTPLALADTGTPLLGFSSHNRRLIEACAAVIR